MRLPVLALLFLAAPVAAQVSDLAPLRALLLPLRTTAGSNTERDAGPELTPVKDVLRRWVEARLPPAQRPGPDGTLIEPDADDLAALAARLTAELDVAGLTCGRFGEPGDRCGADRDSERGFLAPVRLGLLGGGGRYLLVVTGVGVRCGFDESAYVYEQQPDHRWRLLLANEQHRYDGGEFAPQNFLAIDGAPAESAGGDTAPPPLVVMLSFAPWCSSNWNALTTRLWRTSRTDPTPAPLLHRIDGLYLGGEPIAAERLTGTDLLIQYSARSIDEGRLVRPHVARYVIGHGDRLTRTDPIALSPADFIDEWLTLPWAQARRWLDARANATALARQHQGGRIDTLFGEVGAATRCRADPTRWQVRFVEQAEGKRDRPPRWYQVRWSAPYRFRMVAAGTAPFPGCDEKVASPDPVGTLFPVGGKVP